MYNYNFGLLFKDIVNKYNKKIALVDVDGKKFSYKYLDNKSDQFASILNKQEKINIVAIDSKKSVNTIIAFLGCLKLGLAYFFLDLNLPENRIKQILKRTNCKLLISDKKKIRLKINIISVKEKYSNRFLKSNFNMVSSDNAAYIMFTSGSTGEPKGAVISHQSVINFSYWCKKEFKISSKDVISQLNPLYFDNSVFDLYNSFLHGCTLVLTNGLEIDNPEKLLMNLKKNKCSIWFSTPSLLIYLLNFNLINRKKFQFIKKIIFGGEGFPIPKLKELTKILPKKSYYNVYGPTECTCMCSSHLISKEDFFENNINYITLGQIAENFKCLIVNKLNKEVKKGQTGELVLFGPNVGYGYIGDEKLTKQNFISPTKKFDYLRGYKTGDLVKFKRDRLYFIGRKDTQIKHLGYRIELNELEVTLNKHPLINEACVFYVKNKNKFGGKIVCVVAVKKKIDQAETLQFLKKFLPKYFMPQAIFIIKNLPKNLNGKIDRSKIRKVYEKKV